MTEVVMSESGGHRSLATWRVAFPDFESAESFAGHVSRLSTVLERHGSQFDLRSPETNIISKELPTERGELEAKVPIRLPELKSLMCGKSMW